jgi:hypothetical protein
MAAAAVRQTIIGFALAGAVLIAAAFVAPMILPNDDPADVVTRQTARVAVLFWGVAAATLLFGCRDGARAAWIVGAATFVVHVVTAFDRVHGWSHSAAVRHVEAVSGFGAGLFASYAFTLVWAADAAWWGLDRRGYEARPAGLDRLVHGFLAFVVFNATVVYETGFIRWAGAVLFAALGVLWWRRNLASTPTRP